MADQLWEEEEGEEHELIKVALLSLRYRLTFIKCKPYRLLRRKPVNLLASVNDTVKSYGVPPARRERHLLPRPFPNQ